MKFVFTLLYIISSIQIFSQANQLNQGLVGEMLIDSMDFFYDETNYDFIVDTNSQSKTNNIQNTGLFKSYWPEQFNYYSNNKKQIYAIGNYKDGLKTGRWVYYLCDGSKKCEGDYIDGKRNGKWFNYDECNEEFNFGNPYDHYGYFSTLNTFCTYYELGNDVQKEIITFKAGIPDDTMYYFNSNNEIEFKISKKDNLIFYRNNQPLTNRTPSLNGTFCDYSNNSIDRKNLQVFNQKGQVIYVQDILTNSIQEKWYNVNGQIIFECNYIDENGKCTRYNEQGKIESEYENVYQTGKYVNECRCQ